MGRKIFVSYKHEDDDVRPLNGYAATARHYVDLLEAIFRGDHIYKGEKDNEDLSMFADGTIKSHLRDNIFDSSVTIVLISKNMREPNVPDHEQWIPWEISYSLKNVTRDGSTSQTNAMLAIVLPDKSGSYEHFFDSSACPNCSCQVWRKERLFPILGENMFNRKPTQTQTQTCPTGMCNTTLYPGDYHSYIYPVKWDEFTNSVDIYIALAVAIAQKTKDYDIKKEIV